MATSPAALNLVEHTHLPIYIFILLSIERMSLIPKYSSSLLSPNYVQSSSNIVLCIISVWISDYIYIVYWLFHPPTTPLQWLPLCIVVLMLDEKRRYRTKSIVLPILILIMKLKLHCMELYILYSNKVIQNYVSPNLVNYKS